MKRGRVCRNCLRIRLFIMMAFPLIALIYFQPEGAQKLAALLPDSGTIAFAMMVFRSFSFVVKYSAYKYEMGRSEKRQ